MEIKKICESYFNCFSELSNYKANDARITALAILKILTIPTIVIPAGCVIVYGFALLIDRIKQIFDPSPQDQTINQVGLDQLGTQSNLPTPVVNTPELISPKCPERLETFYQKTPKKFTDKIWKSNDYTPREKELLFIAAAEAYQDDDGLLLSDTAWTLDVTTVSYCKWLATKHPNFSHIPRQINQLHDNLLEKEVVTKILPILPEKIDQGFKIYGHPIEVNRNHRTAFVIDMENKTVEFFNSFGKDTSVKEKLTNLAADLSRKYGVKFTYHHRTEGISIQPDGYQCGIWACKLVKERIEQGKTFDPKSCKGFDISQYRKEVFAKVYKNLFFERVGATRFSAHLVNISDAKTEFILDSKIGKLIDQKSIDLDFYFIQWGKENKMPPIIGSLAQQALNELKTST